VYLHLTAAVLLLAQSPTPQQWEIDKVQRSALVQAPTKKAAAGAPVVFVFHGHGGNMKNSADKFRLHELWPEALVVYPQGLPTPGKFDPEGLKSGWQHKAGDHGDRDLKLFDVILNDLQRRHEIDGSRIYATGHSNGGGFTYLLWSQRAGMLAAVAPSAAAHNPQTLTPLPALHLAGVKDEVVPFETQERVIAAIRRSNGCAETGKEWDRDCLLYPSPGKTPVVTFIHQGGHRFPEEGPRLIVRFFKEHARTLDPAVAARPKVPGKLRLLLRERKETGPGSKAFEVVERPVEWDVGETAVIICDMWDDHYCKSAAQRVGVMAPRMNAVITAARNHGVMIIHAPSGTVNEYADTTYRRRMLQATLAKPPLPIGAWCYLDPKVEPPMPVDTATCSCDDAVVGPAVRRFSRQHSGLDIIGYDGISDNGQEIYNYCVQEGIANIVLMGVHTNMCVLGRPFGIRQMVRLGKNVVLVRDLTDAMYDPRQPPYVSHTRGTEMVIEHIEKYWCPSILGADMTRVVEGSAGPSAVSAAPAR
jgi:polyhydroxybutyrate depolymerase